MCFLAGKTDLQQRVLSRISLCRIQSLDYTVWIFQDFSVTQILREINFGQSWCSKNAILRALNLKFYEIVHYLETSYQNSQPLDA